MSPATTPGFGQMDGIDSTSEFGRADFHIDQKLGRTRTIVPVKIMAVTTSGAISPVGMVSIQPLVNMIDSQGNSQAHGTINNVPYWRHQGGSFAIINDPQVGDFGLALVGDRDISNVVSMKGPANPGSRRQFDLADAFYLGGIMGGTPTSFFQFSQNPAGITITDPNNNTMVWTPTGITLTDVNGNKFVWNSSGMSYTDSAGNTFVTNSGGMTVTAANFKINGALQVNGTITTNNTILAVGAISSDGEITAKLGASQVLLSAHLHSGVTTGAGNSGAPVPGT